MKKDEKDNLFKNTYDNENFKSKINLIENEDKKNFVTKIYEDLINYNELITIIKNSEKVSQKLGGALYHSLIKPLKSIIQKDIYCEPKAFSYLYQAAKKSKLNIDQDSIDEFLSDLALNKLRLETHASYKVDLIDLNKLFDGNELISNYYRISSNDYDLINKIKLESPSIEEKIEVLNNFSEEFKLFKEQNQTKESKQDSEKTSYFKDYPEATEEIGQMFNVIKKINLKKITKEEVNLKLLWIELYSGNEESVDKIFDQISNIEDEKEKNFFFQLFTQQLMNKLTPYLFGSDIYNFSECYEILTYDFNAYITNNDSISNEIIKAMVKLSYDSTNYDISLQHCGLYKESCNFEPLNFIIKGSSKLNNKAAVDFYFIEKISNNIKKNIQNQYDIIKDKNLEHALVPKEIINILIKFNLLDKNYEDQELTLEYFYNISNNPFCNFAEFNKDEHEKIEDIKEKVEDKEKIEDIKEKILDKILDIDQNNFDYNQTQDPISELRQDDGFDQSGQQCSISELENSYRANQSQIQNSISEPEQNDGFDQSGQQYSISELGQNQELNQDDQ